MSLHVPPAFAAEDAAALAALIDAHPFATLVTAAGQEPLVTHLPLIRADERTLIGHFARANPHAQVPPLAPSTAIFHGPHAYVSPRWYAEPDRAVPTWNFATVHARGRIETLGGSDAERVIESLVARFEGAGPAAWRFAMSGREREAMLSGIVAFRLHVEALTGKFKLSQNRPRDDRRRVIAALEAEPHPDARATAAWMRAYAPPDGDPRAR
jgi:transcriptional regulator